LGAVVAALGAATSGRALSPEAELVAGAVRRAAARRLPARFPPALASCRELIADGYAAAWTWPPPTTSALPPRGSSTAS